MQHGFYTCCAGIADRMEFRSAESGLVCVDRQRANQDLILRLTRDG